MARLLKIGDTVAYTRGFMVSMCDHSYATGARRGRVLGPAAMDAEFGHTAEPITAETWLIEVVWNDGAVQRINPGNVCTTRSVAFIE